MITVTRFNGRRFVLNAELIRTVESNPDTVVTLVSGEKLVIKETPDEIVERVVRYGRSLRRLMPLDPTGVGDGSPGAGNPPAA